MQFITGDNIIEDMALRVKENIQTFQDSKECESLLFYKIISYYAQDKEEEKKIELVLISRDFGVVIFKTANTIDRKQHSFLETAKNDLLESMQHIHSKLLKVNSLCKGFSLVIPIKGILFTNASYTIENDIPDDLKIAYSCPELHSCIKSLQLNNLLDSAKYADVVSQLDNSRVILRIKTRDKGTKGLLAAEIENNIAIFGEEQRKAVYLPEKGFTILRGLAGSGKTVLLAYKAAILHRDNPNARIVFTFYTKEPISKVLAFVC